MNPSDARGLSRLVISAVTGVTDLVEALHRNISGGAPVLGESLKGPTKGITGIVYKGVRGITLVAGAGLDAALAPFSSLLGGYESSPEREAVLAALNGILGDYLADSGNPLAIPMRLRTNGHPLELERSALEAAIDQPSKKVAVLVHGLCMNDLQWKREGHDHGESLARDLGFTPVYLHYNTGRHISTSGHEFAHTLEHLFSEWPVPVEELVLIGHSMGGLVSRSACHYAEYLGHAWLARLHALVFLGTPHHGAPLERAGNWLEILMSVSPYTAPFARLGGIRSSGIKDLRHGYVLDEDWEGRHTSHPRDFRKPVALPRGVACHAIAATRQLKEASPGRHLPGDGLVSVDSALGLHETPALNLGIPSSRRWVGHGMNHFDLLGHPEVYKKIKRWLEGRPARTRKRKPGGSRAE